MSDQARWKEAKEVLFPAIRWEEQAAPGKEESTIYLGMTVQGIYVDRKDGVGANDSSIYTIEVPGVGKVGVWGSQVLDGKMALVKIGEEVQINYLGTNAPKNKGHKPWKSFSVFSAKPVTQMVEAAPAGATAQAAAPSPVTTAATADAPTTGTSTTPTAPQSAAAAPATEEDPY